MPQMFRLPSGVMWYPTHRWGICVIPQEKSTISARKDSYSWRPRDSHVIPSLPNTVHARKHPPKISLCNGSTTRVLLVSFQKGLVGDAACTLVEPCSIVSPPASPPPRWT
jgi:hypothetical protein